MVYQFKVSLYCQHYIVSLRSSWLTHEDQLKVVCVQLSNKSHLTGIHYHFKANL